MPNQAHRLFQLVRTSDFSMPFREQPYKLGTLGSAEVVHELIDAVDIDDHLLLRGLWRFLSANHLITYHPFFEEAAVIAYISLEAALDIIRQHLELMHGSKKVLR